MVEARTLRRFMTVEGHRVVSVVAVCCAAVHRRVVTEAIEDLAAQGVSRVLGEGPDAEALLHRRQNEILQKSRVRPQTRPTPRKLVEFEGSPLAEPLASEFPEVTRASWSGSSDCGSCHAWAPRCTATRGCKGVPCCWRPSRWGVEHHVSDARSSSLDGHLCTKPRLMVMET